MDNETFTLKEKAYSGYLQNDARISERSSQESEKSDENQIDFLMQKEKHRRLVSVIDMCEKYTSPVFWFTASFVVVVFLILGLEMYMKQIIGFMIRY